MPKMPFLHDDGSVHEVDTDKTDGVHNYYYLHEDGTVIWKPAVIVQIDPNYFDGPFVKKVWTIRTQDDMFAFMGDLMKMGLKPPRGGIYW